jgi:hypothetical protein
MKTTAAGMNDRRALSKQIFAPTQAVWTQIAGMELLRLPIHPANLLLFKNNTTLPCPPVTLIDNRDLG